MMNIDTIKLLKGERRALAKAITLIESQKLSHQKLAQDLLSEIMPQTGKSIRIAISGIPGVGKSTFIEALGLYLITQGHYVAVLAIDPSSPLHGGSILGDKTRMENLAQEEHAFIRPTPTGGAMGGVSKSTRETILLCEAARFDIILVETVGVGQSEYDVAAMVDFFLLLMVPGTGDELQGIKKGILELAHAIIVNKADGENILAARKAVLEYTNAFHLHSSERDVWHKKVITCSALENKNIDDSWKIILAYIDRAKKKGHFAKKRQQQNQEWFKKLVFEMIEHKVFHNEKITKEWSHLTREIQKESMTPYFAAKKIMAKIVK